ncbi:MAG: CPBP family intramembrane metalloprotease [Chloroflexota bacterium]|nr:CPBP family intramembrane metalloprotease [Chloroflexota bacterium]
MSLARRYPLVAFFVLSFAVTWALWIPAAPFLQGLGDGPVPLPALLVALLGGYGPTMAAGAVAGALGGRSGIKSLLRHFLVWRVAPVWYALIVLVPLAVAAAAIALNVALGGAGPTGLDLSRWYLLLPMMLLHLPTGPLAEEAGWRGFALPRLQARFGPLIASLVVGVAWGLWHLPAFFIPGAALPLGATVGVDIVAWYVLGTVATSVFFTWVYNNTRQWSCPA